MAGDDDTREAALPGGPRSEPIGGATPLQDLCGSCEKRGSCHLPRPEGGVWHCASYAWSERGASHPHSNVTTYEAWTMSEIGTIIDRHRGERGELIAILEEIQAKYSYLPEDSLRAVAEKTGRSLVDIYGVATFYRWFSLKPRGKHLLTCCMGTACHVRGAPRIDEELRRQLAVGVGETTQDREITYETQNCLGGCALGPIVVVDGHYFSNVTPGAVAGVVEKTRSGLDRIDIQTDARIFPVEVSCARCNHSLMDAAQLIDDHPSIRVTISFGDQHGALLLSALYGSYTIQSEHEVPPESVADFFCPHCNAHLTGAGDCVECGAPTVPMIVRGGGVVQICSRRGCRGHMLDLTGINA